MNNVTNKIRSKGYWDISIRPQSFVKDRMDYAELEELLRQVTVRFRGWPVPYVDHRKVPRRGDEWIGQDIDADVVTHIEAWRFFRSGQFNHLRAVSADWRTGSEATPVPHGFEAVIEVWEILFYLTEVFEIAARLALSSAGDDMMTVGVGLYGLDKRALVVGQRSRAEFMKTYGPVATPLIREVTLPREQLVAEARTQAVDMSRDYFSRFGWNVSREQLSEHQSELTSMR